MTLSHFPSDKLYRTRLNRHWTKFRERTYALLHGCASEWDKCEQRKQAVVPVFVETPKRGTEGLDNEEGRSGTFCK